MSSFDVWLINFDPGEVAPADRLQDAFGIDPTSARALEQGLPRIVKHSVPKTTADQMREALEAIGGVVDCRPVKDSKFPEAANEPAVFHPPGADLFPGRGIAKIDPLQTVGETGVPRLSLRDLAVPKVPAEAETLTREVVPFDVRAGAEPLSKERWQWPSTSARLLERALAIVRALQPPKTLPWAAATVAAGVAILSITSLFGSSVLQGEANWFGIGVDGVAIYLIGLGSYDLVTLLRS